jgi:hypothetical protein
MGNIIVCCTEYLAGKIIFEKEEILPINNDENENIKINDNNNNEKNNIEYKDSNLNNNNIINEQKSIQKPNPSNDDETKLNNINNNINSISSKYNNKINENFSQYSPKHNNQQSTNKDYFLSNYITSNLHNNCKINELQEKKVMRKNQKIQIYLKHQ